MQHDSLIIVLMMMVMMICIVQVNIVDPLKLTEEFSNILANPVIASRVVATFIVHKGLYVSSASVRLQCIICVLCKSFICLNPFHS